MAIKIGVKEGRDIMASWPTEEASIKAIDVQKRSIEFVMSDESIGRDQEVIRAIGWDLRNYKKNPV